jgi:hypothetical protein
MFGLMRFHSCSFTKSERNNYQQHYCGVCKTLGTFYSQKIRFLLNRDFVFLSEILSDMVPTTLPEELSNHCFSLMKEKSDIPLSLQIGAEINVLYVDCKLKDNIADAKFAKRLWWKFIRMMFRKEFRTVARLMEQWNFPIEKVTYWLNEQKSRESNGYHVTNGEAAVNYYAEPTAVITGLAFQHGANIIGKHDKAALMYKVGYTFGRLLYVLDAFDDFELDYNRKEFNGLQAAFRIQNCQLGADSLNKVTLMIRSLEEDMQQALSNLNFSQARNMYLKKRLEGNVKRKLGLVACLQSEKCSIDKVKKSMKLRQKWEYANDLRNKLISAIQSSASYSKFKTYLITPILTVLVFITPQSLFGNVENQMHQATSKLGEDVGFWGPVLLFFFTLGLAMNGNEKDSDGTRDGSACGDWCVEHCICCRWCMAISVALIGAINVVKIVRKDAVAVKKVTLMKNRTIPKKIYPNSV